MSYKYFDQKNIPYKRCGKLIVATNSSEVKKLDDIMRKGIENEVPGLEMVDSAKIREIEPYCKVLNNLLWTCSLALLYCINLIFKGIKAVWSPNTGIVDWALVTEHYSKDFEELGGKVFKNFPVTGFKEANESNKAGDENMHRIRIFGEGGRVCEASFKHWGFKMILLLFCTGNQSTVCGYLWWSAIWQTSPNVRMLKRT